jgi:alpha 1,2-mannosyltransferase
MAGIPFLEVIWRRPQRIISLIIIVLLLLSLSTYFSLSPNSYDSVRQQFSQLPRPWSSASGSGSSSLKSSLASTGAGLPYTNDLKDMYTHNPGKPTSPEDLMKWATKAADGNYYPPTYVPQMANQAPRAKAGFIVLVRNNELGGMRDSMRDVEDRFNRKYGYPWIFLNSECGNAQVSRSATTDSHPFL